ncbi:hypothetical protein [Arenimonas terrae]|jgi:hypothetical protein|uniref:Lipoprotein n=1 Tax=Arenimonas terrae TaxID=2546226 RepID=A0A5C4RPA9_9GAMM|nr:hypothetical protein [Arenimonas terrae]TNJ32928.1 hypothetical protein E1B00_14550 [Arenimonas terrae]
MNKLMMVVLVLALALVGGCGPSGGDTGDKLFADMSANMREMASILDSVTDEASARAAVPKIDAVREKMRDCARRARALPRPDAATEQRHNEQMQAVMQEVMPKIAGAHARFAEKPELMAILGPALEGMENDL